MSIPSDKNPKAHVDLEIKDATLIFTRVWTELKTEFERSALRFPREIIWLGGAPGAGKGTNTSYIAEVRGITAPPIITSDLLDSPRARKLKDAGGLVGDEEVVGIMLRTLLDAIYENGVIVDGFPRTKVQVECLKMFYDKTVGLHQAFYGTEEELHFPQSQFRIVLLFVDEEESVRRQLARGGEVEENNRRVQNSGVGQLEEVRATDQEEVAARHRYRLFKKTTFEALQSLRQIFHFHFIDAQGPLAEVQANIDEEFTYQSSLELDSTTFDRIRTIPPASQITLHARQELVRRLNSYNQRQTDLFQAVIDLINAKFMPIVERYAITGLTLINSEDGIFNEPDALAMTIDIFAERGYQALVDVTLVDVPASVDLETGEITCRQKRVYRFQIRFAPSTIRRGNE